MATVTLVASLCKVKETARKTCAEYDENTQFLRHPILHVFTVKVPVPGTYTINMMEIPTLWDYIVAVAITPLVASLCSKSA